MCWSLSPSLTGNFGLKFVHGSAPLTLVNVSSSIEQLGKPKIIFHRGGGLDRMIIVICLAASDGIGGI